jgi:hypothetical protein
VYTKTHTHTHIPYFVHLPRGSSRQLLNCHSGFQNENAKKIINKRKMSKDRWIEEKGEK